MDKVITPILTSLEEEEIWKKCSDFPAYEISNFGQIRNAKTKKILKPKFSNSGGYAQVHLRTGVAGKNGKYALIHRLVAKEFCDNKDPEAKRIVDHIDRNRTNNYYKNLRWVTPRENTLNSNSRAEQVFKNSTPIVLVDKETHELINSYSCPNEASKILGVSVRTIVENIHNYRPCSKLGKFMTKSDYEKKVLKN